MKEINVFVSYCNKEHFCIHIDSDHLSEGIYELVPTNENEPAESRLNLTDLNLIELNQDPDQCSEEPKANFTHEGKLRCINPIIFVYIYIYSFNICCNKFICPFKFLGVG